MNEENIREKYLALNKTKLQMARLASALMIAAALAFSWLVSEKTQIAGKSPGIYDDAGILSDATIDKIDERGAALSELTGEKAKLTIVVEKEKSGAKDLEKKAEKLFASHKMGDDGMLVLVCAQKTSGGLGESIGHFFEDLFGGGSQRFAYHKGRNVDYISDARIKEILDAGFGGSNEENFEPNGAFLAAYDAFADLFDDHHGVNSHERSANTAVSNESGPRVGIARVAQVAIGIISLFALVFLVLAILSGKKKSEASRVYKKPFWFGLIG